MKAGMEGHARAVIVIPAFDPTSTLLTLVARLRADLRRSIIVVDDGSSAMCRATFLALAAQPGVEVLSHAVNLGKGHALKTALNHFLLRGPADAPGVVIASADGKYQVDDIRRVAERLEQQPASLVLGRRTCEGDVGFRTRAGQVITRALFRILIGRRLVDPQTSLRAIPRSFIPTLLEIEEGQYEFELAMLVRAAARRLAIVEVPTAADARGPGTHFSPLRDSLRIHFVFLRFLALSIATASLDFALFLAAYLGAHNILLATVVARTGAGTFNFIASRTLVFRSRGSMAREALKYAVLVVVLMGISYSVVTSLVIFGGLGVYVSKLLAEGTLFAASFGLQNLLVFPDREPAHGKSARSAPGRTDWDAYYRTPAAFAPVTRKITEWGILRDARRFAGDANLGHIAELGGGNSAFLLAFRRRFPDAQLSAIDNNALGLGLLGSRLSGDPQLTLIETDVLAPVTAPLNADLVYSVGLVEHFDRAGTARAIGAHFAHVKPGGLVLITFPTPTWLYRATRRLAERAGIWGFPDERPLGLGEVAEGIAQYGHVLGSRTNWAIVLTQGVIVARRYPAPHATPIGTRESGIGNREPKVEASV